MRLDDDALVAGKQHGEWHLCRAEKGRLADCPCAHYCQAIMVNEELEYQVLRRTQDSKLLVIATGRREALNEILGKVELVGTLSGQRSVFVLTPRQTA